MISRKMKRQENLPTSRKCHGTCDQREEVAATVELDDRLWSMTITYEVEGIKLRSRSYTHGLSQERHPSKG